MIGETSTGDCLSNLAKFTIMNFIITHSVLSLNSPSPCLWFAGVFIHDPLRVFVRDLQVKASWIFFVILSFIVTDSESDLDSGQLLRKSPWFLIGLYFPVIDSRICRRFMPVVLVHRWHMDLTRSSFPLCRVSVVGIFPLCRVNVIGTSLHSEGPVLFATCCHLPWFGLGQFPTSDRSRCLWLARMNVYLLTCHLLWILPTTIPP